VGAVQNWISEVALDAIVAKQAGIALELPITIVSAGGSGLCSIETRYSVAGERV
jgi:hypothetical protein